MAFIGFLFSLFLLAFIFLGIPIIGLLLVIKGNRHDNKIKRITTKVIGFILITPAVLVLVLLHG